LSKTTQNIKHFIQREIKGFFLKAGLQTCLQQKDICIYRSNLTQNILLTHIA